MAIYALGDQIPDIHPDAYVHPDAVVIGSVTLGAHASVWPGAVLRADDNEIRIGERTSVQDGVVVHTNVLASTVVGASVTIGHLAHLEGCVVEDHCLIGVGSVVLPGAHIGVEAIVGAGAVVPNNTVVPPLSKALGVPARIIENSVTPGWFDLGVESYVTRAARFRTSLRRLD